MSEVQRELLDAGRIGARLSSGLPDLLNLEIAEQVGSTNEVLAQRARQGDVHGAVLLAEQQTAGRGRQGKPWVSPYACNVYLTIAWQLPGGPQALAGLSLALGAAIADALAASIGCDLQLKWPNDLYVTGRKVGGILIDIVTASSGQMTVMAGVGINVAMPSDAAAAIEQPYTDLSTALSRPISRNRVAASVINGLAEVFGRWPSSGFDAWREAWQQRDLMRDQAVTVSGAQQLDGVARGVNSEGALLVETDAGLTAVWGGDTSLRRLEGAML